MPIFPLNHDLHCHPYLYSVDVNDEKMSVESVLNFAKTAGYKRVCFVPHFWDEDVPIPSNDKWLTDYLKKESFKHIGGMLPLPIDDEVQLLFGCEAEFYGCDKLSVSPKRYGHFDMMVISLVHYFYDFVRPDKYKDPEKHGEILLMQLEGFVEMDLPWSKVGVAHLNFDGAVWQRDDVREFRDAMFNSFTELPEGRLRSVFSKLAKYGAGIELNAGGFYQGWDSDNKKAGQLHLFKTAKEAGCKFYCGSDAHNYNELALDNLYGIVDLLGLTSDDMFIPVQD